MADTAIPVREAAAKSEAGFVRAIGLFDGTMIVVGSMIGSGIFIVAGDISRQTGSPGGLLLTWIITGVLTVSAALAYGELAGMFPRAGGQYIYLREAFSPLWGFLYGWTLFLVIQTGTIAAVAVGFARYLGVLIPSISPTSWLIPPIDLGSKYAISLSVQQFVAILMIVLITFLNTLGVRLGKLIQNIFTSAKTLSLVGLIILGVWFGRTHLLTIADNFSHTWVRETAASYNFAHFWTLRPDVQVIHPGANFLRGLLPSVSAASGLWGVLVAFSVAQVGSLFSADAWNNIGFTAAEVKNPKRDVALAMVLGTAIVIVLYCLANVAYLFTLRFEQIQNAPDDRVATAALNAIFGSAGAVIMAIAIVISTFGCNNGLILAGSRAVYAMASDGLFFRAAARLNSHAVPGTALICQGLWIALLLLMRTRSIDANGAVSYGNLYGDLLNYVVASVLIFYALTVIGIFVLRRKRPTAERPYRAFGYPILPALYVVAAVGIVLVLLLYQTSTAGTGIAIALLGLPVYWLRSRWLARREPATLSGN